MSISLKQGSEISLRFTTDINIGTPTAVVFNIEYQGEIKLQKTLAADITLISSTKIYVRLNKADTVNLAPRTYDLFCLITTGGNELPATPDDGALIITPRGNL